MESATNEFSFLLKPSLIPNAGVGVFATHEIPAGIRLALMPENYRGRTLKREEIPEAFIGYCVAEADGNYECPEEFNHPWLTWYLNHSSSPNAEYRDKEYYAIKLIAKDEEICIDYNAFDEPEADKGAYYFS